MSYDPQQHQNQSGSGAGPSHGWLTHENVSPHQQVQLPESFFTDWPFNMGQGEAFDFLGDFQSQNQDQMNGQVGNGQDGNASGIQDILGVGMPDGFVGAGQIGGVLGSMGFMGGNDETGV
jgi:hypothetical protein